MGKWKPHQCTPYFHTLECKLLGPKFCSRPIGLLEFGVSLVLDPSLKIGFSNQEERLEYGHMDYSDLMGKWCHINTTSFCSYCGSRLLRKLLGSEILISTNRITHFGVSLILDHEFEDRFLKLGKVFSWVRTLEIWQDSEATLVSFLNTFTWALV
jgi:hypothetical protein